MDIPWDELLLWIEEKADPDHRAGFTHRGDRQRAYAILRFPGEEA
jgi:hypothetical protein